MLAEDNNTLYYFIHYNKEKYLLDNKKQSIKKDQKDSIGKSLDNKSVKNILPGYMREGWLFTSDLSLSLKKVWFSKQEFLASRPINNIKYNHLKLQNNKTFYLFNDRLDYALAHYFANFETTKSNINRFLFDLLMALLTKKLSHQNTDK